MSDFNDNEYSYTRSEINQGESNSNNNYNYNANSNVNNNTYAGTNNYGSYQWGPNMNQTPPPAPKKKKATGFGVKLLRVAAIALVFGLVAGIAFQGVGIAAAKLFPAEAVDTSVSDNSGNALTLSTGKNSINSTAVSSATTVKDVSDIAENVMPAIVQVTNLSIVEYRTFFGTQQLESTSAGSGIIISQDSDNIYIATNNHVISGAETLTITFCDDSAVEGTLKGADSSVDLAVVSVAIADIEDETLSKIKIATIGDSDAVVVGESSVVIGNALGYGQSVTTGVISALSRTVEITDDSGNIVSNQLIQTDAAVNPGNSGGALLNIKGEVIGIVSAKYKDTSVEGMGFAIPMSQAASIIEQMISSEVVSEEEASYFGIAGIDITSSLSSQYNLPTGVYISQVVAGSAADEVGIEKGDVITQFAGRSVTSMSSIQNIMQYIPAGTTVEITVAKASNDYEEEVLSVTLQHRTK